jgi:hypothetical protein
VRRPFAVPGVPLGDLQELARPIWRTAVLRLALAAAMLALLAVAFLMALDRDVRVEAFLPPDRSGVVVIDMSASISPLNYRRMGRALRRIAEANEPVGVVVFSDAAYELFPPGTQGKELKPLVRYFTPIPGSVKSAFEARFPANPWQGSVFQAGTRISEGLRVAGDVLRRDGIRNATVLLVSDLDAPQSDQLRLVDTISTLQNDGVEVRIVPLFPQPQNRAFFERLVGRDAFVSATSVARPIQSDELGLGGKMPWLFLGVAGLVVALLAANERACGRLSIPWRMARS